MVDPFQTDLEQSRSILKKFALARALIVTIVTLFCLFLQAKTRARFDLSTVYLYVIFAVALIESFLVAAIIAAGYSPSMRFSSYLLCADLVLISAIILMTGGSQSAFIFLYIPVILSASLLLSLSWSALVATVCSLLFVAAMALQLRGYVLPASPFRLRALAGLTPLYLWADTGMKIFGFYLAAFLGGLLSHRAGLLQSFHENILNSLSSGYISINRDRRVTYVNPAASRLLKRAKVDAVGKDVSAVFPVSDTQPNPLSEAIAKERETHSREIAVTRGDGKTIPVGITVSPILNGARKLLGAVGSFIDLTELKRMEARLRRADRLAAVGEMSASLAHEIRNPVASIRGAIQELSENVSLQDTNKQLMSIALRECDQLGEIISRFLKFVGSGEYEDKIFDIAGLLEEVVQVAKLEIFNGSGIISTDFPSSLGQMTGDRAQLLEALLNVIRNSKEAMPEGGSLRIRAAANAEGRPDVAITVEDEGTGIPPEKLNKLFSPFFTTKPGGTGLGLAIAHRIISAHRGVIDVESNLGAGTRVNIVLPRQDEANHG